VSNKRAIGSIEKASRPFTCLNAKKDAASTEVFVKRGVEGGEYGEMTTGIDY